MCRDLYASLIYSPPGLHPGNPGASDFHTDALLSIPTGREGGFVPSFLTSCQHLSSLVLIIAILTKARGNHKAILICISLIANDIEASSIFFNSSPSPSLPPPLSPYILLKISRQVLVIQAQIDLELCGSGRP